ncbi:MAG: TRAM domain-containing protein, partial [Deltaproteobacteria bacterium]|nr:TRAM domain-containing protein [Deltaproteobacteria bacterium]
MTSQTSPGRNETVTCTIEKLIHGGAGLAHIDGKACFIESVMPGDEVRVRVYKVKRSYLNAKLIDIITPAPERREPPCPQFLSCGGCQWQHMQYDT